ncbi:hypothetical protein D3C87_871100 [compost metagenome]
MPITGQRPFGEFGGQDPASPLRADDAGIHQVLQQVGEGLRVAARRLKGRPYKALGHLGVPDHALDQRPDVRLR